MFKPGLSRQSTGKWRIALSTVALATLSGIAHAQELRVEMHAVNNKGIAKAIGTVSITEQDGGLVFKPELSELRPGLHGFHVHQNPNCGAEMKDGEMTAAAAAGGHFDPNKVGKHDAPWSEGHLGDLPALYVGGDNKATHPVFKPGISLSDLKGRALMIHEGGDNYSDQPKPLGGGGARVACGVIKAG